MQPKGPGMPYQLLFADDALSGEPLPAVFSDIYPGDWFIPNVDGMDDGDGRPYVYSNFAISRDGRISYNLPGQEAAYFVTDSVPHDRWLMGVLRMRADAVLIGDTTVRLELDYLPTAESIYPPDAEAFAAYRQAAGLSAEPLMVVLSYDGRLPAETACLHEERLHIVLATTERGVGNGNLLQSAGTMDVLALGEEAVDLQALMRVLYSEYQVRTLLCEGGANVFANFLNKGLIDEEFVTWCPKFVGRGRDEFRPSYSEGVGWTPQTAPYSRPISMHQHGDYFYLHTRCEYRVE